MFHRPSQRDGENKASYMEAKERMAIQAEERSARYPVGRNILILGAEKATTPINISSCWSWYPRTNTDITQLDASLVPRDHALPLRGQLWGWLTITYGMSALFVHAVGWEYTAISFGPKRVSHNTPIQEQDPTRIPNELYLEGTSPPFFCKPDTIRAL